VGKKGMLLREQKRINAARMYTPAEIEQIKRQAVAEDRAAMEKIREMQRAAEGEAIQNLMNKEWKEREQAMRGADDEESFQKVLALMMHIPVTVLCEKFRWKPIEDESDNRNHLKKFTDAIAAEVDRICSDEYMDIRKYAEECYKKYGVKFEVK
jgi:hypothetical protein